MYLSFLSLWDFFILFRLSFKKRFWIQEYDWSMVFKHEEKLTSNSFNLSKNSFTLRLHSLKCRKSKMSSWLKIIVSRCLRVVLRLRPTPTSSLFGSAVLLLTEPTFSEQLLTRLKFWSSLPALLKPFRSDKLEKLPLKFLPVLCSIWTSLQVES